MIRDEEIEASLRRFRAGQPSRDLLAAAQHRLARRTAVRDLVGGCCIAVAAVFAGFTMLAISVVRMDERIEEALAPLSDREQEVLRLRFGLASDREYTLAEVGRRLGLSRERVRQIEARAVAKLRRAHAA